MPKSRSAPAAHSVIWDSELGDFRNCVDEVEEIEATSQYHGKWMGNSHAEEVCAYAEIVKQGRLGSRGIKLKHDRKIMRKDLATLLPNHEKIPAKLKNSFLKAHNQHTANLFKEPEQDLPELFYPFFLENEEGRMHNENDFTANFWKSLARTPSKARFEGFQMSVLGRFGKRWRQTLLDLVKLMIIMRFIPPELRKMARFPIPKPGKTNEYRPISLCNDIYCYINAVITSYSSLGIEKADILHDGMCAYRKGKGCSSLVTMELSFREDCNEHNLPVMQLDEDEEKFFDRIPVAILLAAMRINGFPNQGFLEIKASSMQAKTVEIITSKGIAYAKFVCGLEQGNPDSPTISNLVIKLKHDIWKILTDEAKKILSDSTSVDQGEYEFQTVVEGSLPVRLGRIGYCDDNSKFCCVQDENDLLFLATYYLQLSGDLSMVTKIGRKSSKCELQFYNISAHMALKLKEFLSTAWSYIEDGPVEEAVPFKINMKQEELSKLYKLIDYYNLDNCDKKIWDNILHAKAHKHLGLKCNLSGDTSTSCQETISKIKDRVHSLKLRNMHEDAQTKSINMLCATMHSFVPLQMQYNCEDLKKLDKIVCDNISKRRGITSSDATHRFYLPKEFGGMNITSFLDQDLISVTRELEVVSNMSALEGEAFRTRIQATCNYDDDLSSEEIINHARFSILKLARFGIYFRDASDDLVNNILAEMNRSDLFASVGTEAYKNGNTSSLGNGKLRNSQLALGSNIWKALKFWNTNGRTWDSNAVNFAKSLKVNSNNLQKFTNNAAMTRFRNLSSMFSFWEWRNKNFTQKKVSSNSQDWKFVDMSDILRKLFPNSFLTLSDTDIKREAKSYMEIRGWSNFNPHSEPNSHPVNKYGFYHKLFEIAIKKGSPLFISTDGAHDIVKAENLNDPTTSTTAAFVISIADIRQNESIKSGQWIDRPVLPLVSRASKLPPKIGNTASDIATGELWAFALAEISLPKNIP